MRNTSASALLFSLRNFRFEEDTFPASRWRQEMQKIECIYYKHSPTSFTVKVLTNHKNNTLKIIDRILK